MSTSDLVKYRAQIAGDLTNINDSLKAIDKFTQELLAEYSWQDKLVRDMVEVKMMRIQLAVDDFMRWLKTIDQFTQAKKE